MSSEVLRIPTDHLEDFCNVVMAGISVVHIDPEVAQELTEWCQEMADYYEFGHKSYTTK